MASEWQTRTSHSNELTAELLDTCWLECCGIYRLIKGSNIARRRESLGWRLREGNPEELIDRRPQAIGKVCCFPNDHASIDGRGRCGIIVQRCRQGRKGQRQEAVVEAHCEDRRKSETEKLHVLWIALVRGAHVGHRAYPITNAQIRAPGEPRPLRPEHSSRQYIWRA